MHVPSNDERDAGRALYHEHGLQTGPEDSEGAGRSRYWDTPTKDRPGMVKKILKLTAPFNSAYDQRFARGWLDELRRAQEAGKTR